MANVSGLIKIALACLLMIASAGLTMAQSVASGSLDFIPNGGQWDSRAIYRATLPGGAVFLERDRLTFDFADQVQLAALHDLDHHAAGTRDTVLINHHAYQVIFRHARPAVRMSSEGERTYYHNYFSGNDPSRWVRYQYPVSAVRYDDLYDGIAAVIYSSGPNLKYDLEIAPGADPGVISLLYVGVDDMELHDGNLIIRTSVNEIQELQPVAYQYIGGNRVEVQCRYLLRGNELSFYFPQDYDERYELIIDPVLVASTYTFSTTKVEGWVAGYDSSGNIYGAGVVKDPGYPGTIGAYQASSNGGDDIVILKFNQDGSQRLWATNLGGAERENVYSLISNSNNDLVILGTAGDGITSPPPGYPPLAFPTTAGAYGQVFNGGNYDLFIAILEDNGANLLASTFIGGSGTDGENDINYASEDRYKGELILDALDNVYVATCTKSNNFPATPGAFQTSSGGGLQDAVVFKMNPALTGMTWSTYLGGNGKEMAYSLALHPSGNIYVAGCTQSANFPTTGGTYLPSFQGSTDGYVAVLNSTGSALNSVCFMGDVTSHDQTHYIGFDAAGDVYVYGHSDGTMPVTAGAYNNPNSGLFVQKYDPGLSSLLVATVVGSGSGEPDLVPSAFNIDICDFVYIGGFERTDPDVADIPTTPDAFQTTSNGVGENGTNFYFMVFDRDLTAMRYGTYIGGQGDGNPGGGEHSHGGSSRWDSKGAVYQAVCNIRGDFPTTPSAFSPTKQVVGQSDMVVFKFDFEQTQLEADALPLPSDEGCVPFTVDFLNQSKNASQYTWDFDDNGATSTDTSPTYTFTDTGTYNITLIADNPASCFEADTFYLTITVLPSPIANFGFTPPSPVSALTTIQFSDSSIDADTWRWDFGDGSPLSTSINPAHVYSEDGTYDVCLRVADVGGCEDSICKTIIVTTEGAAEIPTAFSPNGDNVNDIYYVIGYGLRTFEFRIYNRWGQVVFESNDMTQGWDGTWDGEPQPLGVYAYYVRGEKFNGEEIVLKGNVTLIR